MHYGMTFIDALLLAFAIFCVPGRIKTHVYAMFALNYPIADIAACASRAPLQDLSQQLDLDAEKTQIQRFDA